MRKATTLLVAATALAVTVANPEKAKASCWECWAGGAVIGGALVAGSAYAHGYNRGYYGQNYGPGYYAPPRPATYGYYSPPYYDYTPGYYQPEVRYVKRVRYVRQEYVEPVYYQPAPQPVYYQRPAPEPVYYQQAPEQNWVRTKY